MIERTGVVTIHGKPLTLVGEAVKVGAPAPDVELLDNDLNPVRLSTYRGKILVIASVPSLDTPVCDLETRRFNDEAANLGADVEMLTVSMDLPFAQKRWCGAAGVKRLKTLSDHRERGLRPGLRGADQGTALARPGGFSGGPGGHGAL